MATLDGFLDRASTSSFVSDDQVNIATGILKLIYQVTSKSPKLALALHNHLLETYRPPSPRPHFISEDDQANDLLHRCFVLLKYCAFLNKPPLDLLAGALKVINVFAKVCSPCAVFHIVSVEAPSHIVLLC